MVPSSTCLAALNSPDQDVVETSVVHSWGRAKRASEPPAQSCVVLSLQRPEPAQHTEHVICVVLFLPKPLGCLRVAKLQREGGHAPDVKHVRLTALSHVLQTTVDHFRYFYRLGCSPLLSLRGEPVKHTSDVGFAVLFSENPIGRLRIPGPQR